MPCRPFALAALGLALNAAAQAQDAPPIKPGLWQVQTERGVNGQVMPDPGERLKKMPPEARARMEAMMKQRGVDMSGSGGMRICLDRDTLAQGGWQGRETRCKTDMLSRDASAWKWRSTCTQPDSQSTGEARFDSAESYTVTSDTTLTMRGETRSTHHVARMKWLGADCGDVKPISAMQPRPAKP